MHATLPPLPPPRRYHLRTAQAVDYADRFFAFCAAAALDPNLLGLKPTAVLQPYNTHSHTGAGGVTAERQCH